MAFLILGIKFFEQSKLLSEGPCTFYVLTTIWLFQKRRTIAIYQGRVHQNNTKADSTKAGNVNAPKKPDTGRLPDISVFTQGKSNPFLNKMIHGPGACLGIHIPASVYLGNHSSLNINEAILHHMLTSKCTQRRKRKQTQVKPSSAQTGVSSGNLKAPSWYLQNTT